MHHKTSPTPSKPFKYLFKCNNPVCSAEFGSNRKHTKTCSSRCQKALQRSKQEVADTKRLYRFETSPFAYFLAAQAIRAETVQVVPNTLELLAELHQVTKLASRADGYGEYKEYALCHLYPVKGMDSIGTLHPSNIVVADRSLNRKHSNSLPTPGIGHSILRATLSPQWKVYADTPKKLVIKKLVSYLGEAFCAKLAVKLKLQPATRQKYLDIISQTPSHPAVIAAGDLSQLPTAQLSFLVAEITGKTAGRFSGSYGMNPGEVFLAECKRLCKHYPQLEIAHDEYQEAHSNLLDLYINADPLYKGIEGHKEAKKTLQPIVSAMFGLFHGTTSVKAFVYRVTTDCPLSDRKPTPEHDSTLLFSHSMIPESLKPIVITQKSKPVSGDTFLAGLDDPSPIDEMVFPEYMTLTPETFMSTSHFYDAHLPF
jgi:hypothetical protein